MSLEAMLIAPFLLVMLMFCYMFFGAFEAKARANKANYTISDYLSRQTDAIDATFLDGLADVYRFLNNQGDIDMRTSAIQYTVDTDGNGSHKLIWSYATGDYLALTDETLATVEQRVPILADGEEVLLIETVRPWTAPFSVLGIDPNFEFLDIVATKPRFATQVPFDDGTSDTTSESTSDTTTDESTLTPTYDWQYY